jgi:hypothetical protein
MLQAYQFKKIQKIPLIKGFYDYLWQKPQLTPTAFCDLYDPTTTKKPPLRH